MVVSLRLRWSGSLGFVTLRRLNVRIGGSSVVARACIGLTWMRIFRSRRCLGSSQRQRGAEPRQPRPRDASVWHPCPFRPSCRVLLSAGTLSLPNPLLFILTFWNRGALWIRVSSGASCAPCWCFRVFGRSGLRLVSMPSDRLFLMLWCSLNGSLIRLLVLMRFSGLCRLSVFWMLRCMTHTFMLWLTISVVWAGLCSRSAATSTPRLAALRSLCTAPGVVRIVRYASPALPIFASRLRVVSQFDK